MAATMVTVHVFDEGKAISQDFCCDVTTLLNSMRFFRTYLKNVNPSTGQNVEISVHCDVSVFDYLLRYAKTEPKGRPPLTTSMVLPVLISSNFLQMEELVEQCVQFLACNLPSMSKHQNDLLGLPTELISRLAKASPERMLEELHGSIEAGCQPLVYRLYKHKLEALLRQLHTTVARCSRCEAMFSLADRSKLVCAAKDDSAGASSLVQQQAAGTAGSRPPPPRHEVDPGWRFQDHLSALRTSGAASWRDIYWDVWGVVHVMYCHHCTQFFPAQELPLCSHHPEPPIFMAGKTQGRFPCCGGHAHRTASGVLQFSHGCCVRDHTVQAQTPTAGAAAPGLPPHLQAAMRILQEHRQLIVPEITVLSRTLAASGVGEDEDEAEVTAGGGTWRGAGEGSSLAAQVASGLRTSRQLQQRIQGSQRARAVSAPRGSVAGPGAGGGSSIAGGGGPGKVPVASFGTAQAKRKSMTSLAAAINSGERLGSGSLLGDEGAGAADQFKRQSHEGMGAVSLGAGARKASGSLHADTARGDRAGVGLAPELAAGRDSAAQQAGAMYRSEQGPGAGQQQEQLAYMQAAPATHSASQVAAAAGWLQASPSTQPAAGGSTASGSGDVAGGAAAPSLRVVPLSNLSGPAGTTQSILNGGGVVAGASGSSTSLHTGGRKLRLELLHEDDNLRMEALISHLSACRPSRGKAAVLQPGGSNAGPAGGPARGPGALYSASASAAGTGMPAPGFRGGGAAGGSSRPPTSGVAGFSFSGGMGSGRLLDSRGASGWGGGSGSGAGPRRPVSAPRMRPTSSNGASYAKERHQQGHVYRG